MTEAGRERQRGRQRRRRRYRWGSAVWSGWAGVSVMTVRERVASKRHNADSRGE
ncbi:hypothetical protein ACNKHX_18435 [Shigella flexneri]